MRSLRRALAVVLIVAALAILGVATSGPPPPTPNPPGTFSFAVVGDQPYYPWEELQFRLVRQVLDQHELAFVVHVGDALWRPCSDRQFRKVLGWLQALRHPVVLTPGDNDWTDCWEPAVGGFVPLERLAKLRELFFSEPGVSLGAVKMPLVSQAAQRPADGLPENVRWVREGVVFAAVHMVGSLNGHEPFPGRGAADDAAADRRLAAAVAWIGETFETARASQASSVVLAFHASPMFGRAVGDPERAAYEPFLEALEREAKRFGGPVLLAHGDDHVFVVDRPLVDRVSGRRLDNVTRLQVPGSPDVGWVRVVVTPGARTSYAFESQLVPRWKYW